MVVGGNVSLLAVDGTWRMKDGRWNRRHERTVALSVATTLPYNTNC